MYVLCIYIKKILYTVYFIHHAHSALLKPTLENFMHKNLQANHNIISKNACIKILAV